jgi:hypothetical protein
MVLGPLHRNLRTASPLKSSLCSTGFATMIVWVERHDGSWHPLQAGKRYNNVMGALGNIEAMHSQCVDGALRTFTLLMSRSVVIIFAATKSRHMQLAEVTLFIIYSEQASSVSPGHSSAASSSPQLFPSDLPLHALSSHSLLPFYRRSFDHPSSTEKSRRRMSAAYSMREQKIPPYTGTKRVAGHCSNGTGEQVLELYNLDICSYTRHGGKSPNQSKGRVLGRRLPLNLPDDGPWRQCPFKRGRWIPLAS